MFGQNEITKSEHGRTDPFDGTVRVHSMFYTLQGEGPYSGYPAVFVRLQHCNLACQWCDTAFDSGAPQSIESIVETVNNLFNARSRRTGGFPLVVITGGEPMLQRGFVPLCRALIGAGYIVQIETAGTVMPPDLPDFINTLVASACYQYFIIVCSPKTKSIAKELVQYVDHWKYILRHNKIADDDGLPMENAQTGALGYRVFRPWDVRSKVADDVYHIHSIYVSPCDEHDESLTRKNMLLARDVALRYGYKLSLQVHKIVGVE